MIPAPTADKTKLRVKTIRKTTTWYRISDPEFPSPLFFSTDQSNRWNSPSGEYGVCYVAKTVETAFAETYGRNVMTRFKAGQLKIISETELKSRNVFSIQTQSTLHFGEMYGKGLAKLNLDNTINTTTNYTEVHPWSLWVYSHIDNLDGLQFQSRHLSDNQNIALFDRARVNLIFKDLGSVNSWVDPKTGKTIDDILEEQAWMVF